MTLIVVGSSSHKPPEQTGKLSVVRAQKKRRLFYNAAMRFLGVFLFLFVSASATLLTNTSTAEATFLPLPGSTQQPLEQINHLLNQHNPYPGSKLSVSLDPEKARTLKPCKALQLSLPRQQGLRKKTTLRAACQAPQQWVRYIQADLRIEGSYPVAARTLAPGTLIDESMLILHKGDLLQLGQGLSYKKHELLGYITTQRIVKNSPIKTSALRAPGSIQRGQKVRLIVKGPGFSVTSNGTALQNTNPGVLTNVRTRSGKIVSGQAINSTTVEIQP